jgi:serine/threonine protein kinase
MNYQHGKEPPLAPEKLAHTAECTKYADLLNMYNTKYTEIGQYLQVGNVDKVQGWILHVSVIVSQLPRLLKVIIPELVSENVPFRIVLDKTVAKDVLDGHLGITQVGKLISIYPSDENQAAKLAIQLTTITQEYKGPNIPTDYHLGGRIYTRYGGINPLLLSDATGKQDKYIYNSDGVLTPDPYCIPFSLPHNITWPYAFLGTPDKKLQRKLYKKIYKPVSTLKHDPRGNVYKAIYIKGAFKIARCVLKQGVRHMISDDYERDIIDRLIWQKELHQKMADLLPIPKILDYFMEDENGYLVMEYIKGKTLYEHIMTINHSGTTWTQMSNPNQIRLIDYLLEIIRIINIFHENGYIHRDITTQNFIINEKGKLYLIDIELAYSLKENKPTPPFGLGTPGFMSPEQLIISSPTFKEDIYGIGALMIELFTSLSPLKFATHDIDYMKNQLNFFIENQAISDVITACLDYEPNKRPDLLEVQAVIVDYRQHLSLKSIPEGPTANTKHLYNVSNNLTNIIQSALLGLSRPPTLMSDKIWISRVADSSNNTFKGNRIYSIDIGIQQGISGVMYVLSQAKLNGFDISSSQNSYQSSLKYIEDYYLNHLPNIAPGLYFGAAGIAIMMAKGIEAHLIESSLKNANYIEQCLTLPPVSLDVSSGIAGQGIATLLCASVIGPPLTKQLLQKFTDQLLDTQEKDGSWSSLNISNGKKAKPKLGFGQGVTGITWLLLEYFHLYNDTNVHTALMKSLQWIRKQTNDLKCLQNEIKLQKLLQHEENPIDVASGLVLTFIKAYETLKLPIYRQIVEDLLSQYPQHATDNNYSQYDGLTGFGEIYMEAGNVFNNPNWISRANWIANVITHTLIPGVEGSGYWLLNETTKPTADLLTGNSGIIHFLLRCNNPSTIRYRLLT